MTPEIVAKIRACDRAGIKTKMLCEVFGMSRSGIYDIITYKHWKDVPDTDGIRRSSRPSIRGKR
jgi:predicted DNA-binding transcriptional regulator AlpA